MVVKGVRHLILQRMDPREDYHSPAVAGLRLSEGFSAGIEPINSYDTFEDFVCNLAEMMGSEEGRQTRYNFEVLGNEGLMLKQRQVVLLDRLVSYHNTIVQIRDRIF